MDCSQTKISFAFAISGCVVFGLVGLVAAVSNTIIVIVMIKDPLKKLHTTFNYLLVNLCVCDFLTAVVTLPITSYDFYHQQYGIRTSKTEILVSTITGCAVMFSMCALSIDRYKAIINPIKYRQNLSWGRCVKYTLVVWLLAIPGGVALPFYISVLPIAFPIYLNIVIVVSIVIMITVCARVQNALRSHSDQFKDKMKESLTASQEMIESRLRTEKKVTSVYTVILSIFLGTLIPSLILLDVYVFVLSKHCYLGFIFNSVRYLLVTVNSIANPWVCTLRLKAFKESTKALFGMKYERLL